MVNIFEDGSPEMSVMEIGPTDQAILIFSDVDENNKRYEAGKRLAKLIKKEKLGIVIALPPARNPNTGNMVKTWAWKLAPQKLASFQKRLFKADEDKWAGTAAGDRLNYRPYDHYNYNRW